MDGASEFIRQTVTADTTPAAITWPSPRPNAEVQLYVSTPNGPVELLMDASDTQGDGIEIPDAETNYAAGRWVINATERPAAIWASAATDCEVLMLIYG